MMKRIFAGIVCLYLTGGYVNAALLTPMTTMIDCSIEGNAMMMPYPMPATFNLNGQWSAWPNGGCSVQADDTLGPIPPQSVPGMPAPHPEAHIDISAMAGANFEQVAFNEYVLTLSGASLGEIFHCPVDPMMMTTGQFNTRSLVSVSCDFFIGDMMMPNMDPATILLEVEHYGTMTRTNHAHATSTAGVQVMTGSGSWDYHCPMLETPPFMPGPFQEVTWQGTRDVTEEGEVITINGDNIHIDAVLETTAMFMPDPGMPGIEGLDHFGAGNDFDSGLRLRLTVLPEPMSISLLAIGGMTLLRRRQA